MNPPLNTPSVGSADGYVFDANSDCTVGEPHDYVAYSESDLSFGDLVTIRHGDSDVDIVVTSIATVPEHAAAAWGLSDIEPIRAFVGLGNHPSGTHFEVAGFVLPGNASTLHDLNLNAPPDNRVAVATELSEASDDQIKFHIDILSSGVEPHWDWDAITQASQQQRIASASEVDNATFTGAVNCSTAQPERIVNPFCKLLALCGAGAGGYCSAACAIPAYRQGRGYFACVWDCLRGVSNNSTVGSACGAAALFCGVRLLKVADDALKNARASRATSNKGKTKPSKRDSDSDPEEDNNPYPSDSGLDIYEWQ